MTAPRSIIPRSIFMTIAIARKPSAAYSSAVSQRVDVDKKPNSVSPCARQNRQQFCLAGNPEDRDPDLPHLPTPSVSKLKEAQTWFPSLSLMANFCGRRMPLEPRTTTRGRSGQARDNLIIALLMQWIVVVKVLPSRCSIICLGNFLITALYSTNIGPCHEDRAIRSQV